MGRGRQKSVECDSHSQAGLPDLHKLIFQNHPISKSNNSADIYWMLGRLFPAVFYTQKRVV